MVFVFQCWWYVVVIPPIPLVLLLSHIWYRVLLYLTLSPLMNYSPSLLLASLITDHNSLLFPGGYLLFYRCSIGWRGLYLAPKCPSSTAYVIVLQKIICGFDLIKIFCIWILFYHSPESIRLFDWFLWLDQ